MRLFPHITDCDELRRYPFETRHAILNRLMRIRTVGLKIHLVSAVSMLGVFTMGALASVIFSLMFEIQSQSEFFTIAICIVMGMVAGLSFVCHINTSCTLHFLRKNIDQIIKDGVFQECTKCNYDLRGTPDGICPECGNENKVSRMKQ